jgi:hypothetical protein
MDHPILVTVFLHRAPLFYCIDNRGEIACRGRTPSHVRFTPNNGRWAAHPSKHLAVGLWVHALKARAPRSRKVQAADKAKAVHPLNTELITNIWNVTICSHSSGSGYFCRYDATLLQRRSSSRKVPSSANRSNSSREIGPCCRPSRQRNHCPPTRTGDTGCSEEPFLVIAAPPSPKL